MKVQINDIQTLRPLTLALRKAHGKHSLNILNDVIIRAKQGAGRVEFVVTDLDTVRCYTVEGSVEQAGAAAVDLNQLHKIVNKLRKFGGGLGIELVESDNDLSSDLNFTNDNLDFQLEATLKDDFVKLVETVETVEDANNVQEISAARLKGVLKSALKAASKDTARQNLCGVQLKGNNIVSTDGHRLRYQHVPGLDIKGELIVRRKAVKALVYALGKFDADVVKICANDKAESHASFEFGEHKVVTRLIDGTFPDYAQVLPKSYDYELFTNRKIMLKKLEAVAILADKNTHAVRLKLEHDNCQFEVFCGQGGANGQSDVGGIVNGAGGSVTVQFNYKFFKDALKDLDSENVIVQCTDTLSPISIKIPDDKYSEWIVMPMRM